MNMIKMKTNEDKRIISDRQIPLTIIDIMYEILGNMKGKLIDIRIEDDILKTYTDDYGFNEQDKKAIFEKNSSGNNEKTAGLNGHGIKLSIDRLLPQDGVCNVYSINKNNIDKCNIGHFEYSEWESVENFEGIFNSKSMVEKGSYFEIPLNNDYINEIYSNMDKIILSSKKYLNRLIADKKIIFKWNNIIQHIDYICPKNDKYIEIDYSIGYNTPNELDKLKDNHKLPLLFNINKINRKLDIPNIFHIKRNMNLNDIKDFNKEYTNFKESERGILRLTILPLKKNEPQFKGINKLENKYTDGTLIYINNHNINEKAIIKYAKTHKLIVTVEDNTVHGGAGSAVLEVLSKHKIVIPTITIGIPDKFVSHGSQDEIYRQCGLDKDSIRKKIVMNFK